MSTASDVRIADNPEILVTKKANTQINVAESPSSKKPP